MDFSVKGSMVIDNVHNTSFNCTNKATAKELCRILENYETLAQTNATTIEQLLEADKQLKQVLMTLAILSDDIQKLRGVLE